MTSGNLQEKVAKICHFEAPKKKHGYDFDVDVDLALKLTQQLIFKGRNFAVGHIGMYL